MDETQKYFVDFGDYLSPEIYKIIEKCANEIIDKICETEKDPVKRRLLLLMAKDDFNTTIGYQQITKFVKAKRSAEKNIKND